MASIQKVRQNNTSQTLSSPGFDDALKLRAKQNGELCNRNHPGSSVNYDTEKTRKIRNEYIDHQLIKDSEYDHSNLAAVLKNDHNTAPIIAMPLPGNDLHLPDNLEYKQLKAGEKALPKRLQPGVAACLPKAETDFGFMQAQQKHSRLKTSTLYLKNSTEQIINTLEYFAGDSGRKTTNSKSRESDNLTRILTR